MNEKRYTSYKQYLIDRYGEKVWKIPIQTQRTCPNRDGSKGTGGCIYCSNLAFHPINLPQQNDLHAQIESSIQQIKEKRGVRKFIAYFQTFTNTYAPVSELKAMYDVIREFNEIVGLSIGTRPDCVSDEILKLIQSYAEDYEVWIEYGLQSADNETLKRINRGHTVQDFMDAVQMTSGREIRQCVHIILGLPGETLCQIHKTAKLLSELPIDGVKLHPLQVIRGTKLESMYMNDDAAVLDWKTYIEWLVDVLELLAPDIVIQRLTADAPKDLLIAPDWCRDKLAVLRSIDQEMNLRDTWQGKKYNGNRIT